MPYITREDGEHFVIPSYRDVLSSKSKSQLKKDIILLSQSYGEFITMQKKSALQYEVAFSPDIGYLLGETIWQHFKKPDDLIYCEEIPGSTEVILAIVKDGSVYLDGNFPVENVSEELVVFLTQQAHFEIYIYGEVPITELPTEGKFSFEAASLKSFTVLENPVFPILPLIPIYKLQPVEAVIRAHGIGIIPVKQIVMVALLLAVGWYLYDVITRPPEQVAIQEQEANPYQNYIMAMNSVLPDEEVIIVFKKIDDLLAIPGWEMTAITYQLGQIEAKVQSNGGTVEELYTWAKKHEYTISLNAQGYVVNVTVNLLPVDRSGTINHLDDVIAVVIDRIAKVSPGNHVSVSEIQDFEVYKSAKIDVSLDEFTPVYLNLVGQQFKDLPLVVQMINGTFEKSQFKGTITLTVLGN